MDRKIDKLISLSIQIAQFLKPQTDGTFEERATTILQFYTLCYLEKQPQAKLSEIAKYLNASLSSTTQLVERMHKSNLLIRVGDKTDRRVIHHILTEEGKAMIKQTRDAKRNRMKKMLSKIDSHDIDELIRIQEKIMTGLKEEGHK